MSSATAGTSRGVDVATYHRPHFPPDSSSEESSTLTAAKTDKYLESRLSHMEYAADPSLARGQERANAAGMPKISVSPMQGQFLSVLARGMRAEKILEIGTLAGYSTTFLARSLPSHGRIDTLEFSPLHARIAQENFIDSDLYPFPTIHIGPALDILRDPNGAFASPPGTEEGLPVDERGYDLCFIDADKGGYYGYWLECLRLTRKGGMIILDNAIQDGRITLDKNVEGQHDVSGLRKVYDWVKEDGGKTVLMSGIQTVGGKHWDGFAIAVKL
ncbi:S-adenosyl-L-methionine-dependent methyltransferase [Dioszegia hungarica]|uniref:S-adenosyl-L-methionine-dependent methyltransferase n=1 Tax=Dioszegia hungarica TaxID=4972 RepID=A0AA38HAU8_9TREE|nr:S-adenosyl-L-methionine-dependent methyltransferase [Dioszegia hungarica]KAI9637553.1 S-adenosyl-L-methionine-dependent methyltransferase [Dioszegia hungarica]